MVEDDYTNLLANARQRHLQALEELALAHAELAVSVDLGIVGGRAANTDAERPRRAVGIRR